MDFIKDRLDQYWFNTDYTLMDKVPIAIHISGKSFKKLTSEFEKPFSIEFSNIMAATALKLVQEVEGTQFLYSWSDNFFLILRNDLSENTEPWFNNRLQKITSCVSSIASLAFFKNTIDIGVSLPNDPIFVSHTFTLPNLNEVMSNLILKQQQSYNNCVQNSAFAFMAEKIGGYKTEAFLRDKSIQEKLSIIDDNFSNKWLNLPKVAKFGFSIYRKQVENSKRKWHCDTNLQIWNKDKSLLQEIFNDHQ